MSVHVGRSVVVGCAGVVVDIAVAVGGADSFSWGSPHQPGASEAPAHDLNEYITPWFNVRATISWISIL